MAAAADEPWPPPSMQMASASTGATDVWPAELTEAYEISEASAAFHGYKPLSVLEDVATAFQEYAKMALDEAEATLKERQDLAKHHREIEQGVKAWQEKLQRTADSCFNQFMAQAVRDVFYVPERLGQVPEVEQQTSADDDENVQADPELIQQLQQQLVIRKELQRKLAEAQKAHAIWQSQEARVNELVKACDPAGVHRVLDSAQQMQDKLAELRQKGLVQESEAGGRFPLAAASCSILNKRKRALPRRLLLQREPIATVSLGDLKTLSSMLCI